MTHPERFNNSSESLHKDTFVNKELLDLHLDSETQRFKKETQQLKEEIILSAQEKNLAREYTYYLQKIFTSEDIAIIQNMFPGKNLQESVQNFLKEKKQIDIDLKKWSTESRDALQTTMLILGTVKVCTDLNEFYNSYAKTQSLDTTQYQKNLTWLTQHYESLQKNTNLMKNTKDELDKKYKTTESWYTDNSQKDKLTSPVTNYLQDSEELLKNPQKKLSKQLSHIVSSWFRKDPNTKTTLCSQTAQIDAKTLFHINLPRGNAFDAMRAGEGNYKTSIVSDLYKKKEKITKKIDSVHDTDYLWKSSYINTLADWTNFADLYVTSSTSKGKKYWHRATMFRSNDQWYVIDPYTVVQSWEDKNKPRTLESYANSMKTGNNKRDFMRMNFYDAPVNLDTAV